TILILAISALSWHLLDIITQISDVIPPAVSFMIRTGIAFAVIIAIIIIFYQLRAPARLRAGDCKIETIIADASVDPEQTRTAIIRLRQILEPDQMKLAVTLATLLEGLLTTIESTSKKQQFQEQEHHTLSQAASELKVKHDQLIQAPHLRSEFLSRVGDEITSPMHNLGSLITLLNKMDLNNKTKELLTIVTHSAYILIENLTNIVEFSKLDSQQMQLQKKHFNITSTLSTVIEKQESTALSKSLIVESQISPDVPDTIFGAQKPIVKILNNLLSNAIRFTDKGTISIAVENQSTMTKRFLCFTVTDTGIGIPENALSGIFDSLDKDTDLVNSSFTGRLRLIVSKQLCELMGGEIGVLSKQGIGSQFWFTIDISED
ncbi:MAG: hypothetical protein GY829_03435, partial [Gammaproteobacteria bacterium]|nr:hypothetical protein [Gammaproteobacteria bacterium]